MSRRKIIRLALSTIAVLLAGLLLVHYWRQAPFDNSASAGDKHPTHDADASAPKSDRYSGHDASKPSENLPPDNAPLVKTLKDLKRLSDTGNAAASMRLFKDLRKCELRLGAESILNGIYYHRPGQTDAEYTQQITQKLAQEPALKTALKQLDGTDTLCSGVSADSIESRGNYLRQAALQNNPEAMVCYATSYELGPKYLSDAWFDYATRWRQEAPYFAQQALDAGQPSILAPLIDAYMPERPDVTKIYPLSEAIGPDPKLAYALSLLYSRLAQGADRQQAQNNLATLSNDLQPNELADAQALADSMWPRFQQAGSAGAGLAPCAEFLSPSADTSNIQGLQ